MPWFSRLLTVQEVELAHRVVLMHGKTEAKFDEISTYLIHVLTTSHPLSDPYSLSHTYQKELLQLRRTRVDDPWDGFALHKRLDLVRRTALGKAAVPHDKIYAIRAVLQLGLEEDHFPLPDYDSDFNETYRKTCVTFMRASHIGLKLIQDVGGSVNAPGPSWVADFNRPIQGSNSILWETTFFDYRGHFLAPKLKLFDDDRRIESRAHLLTSIAGTINHTGLDKLFRTFETDEERACAALSAAECLWLWIRTWETLSPTTTSDWDQDRLRHLMFRHEGFILEREILDIQKRLVELVRKTDESTFDLTRFQKHQKAHRRMTGKKKTSVVKNTPRGSEVNITALLSWNKAPRDIDPTPDEGLWDAFRTFWDICNGSAFFWTEDNALGISLPVRRAGDVVALIPGVNWPMLLRRSPNGYYRVVSAAYIVGLDGRPVCEGDNLRGIVLE